MSDHIGSSLTDSAGSHRGQSLVEFALVLPMLLVLLLLSIDLGRAFFGWVVITNASRVGANYAAQHPKWTPDDELRFAELVDADAAVRNCVLGPLDDPTWTTSDGSLTSNPTLGDYATVRLTCDFTLVMPFSQSLLGSSTVSLTAETTFPVRNGCVNCPTPSAEPEPQAPDHCREVPLFVGMSVQGGRLAWESAGFTSANFAPIYGQNTETISSFSLVQDDPDASCPPGWAIFSSSVTVATYPPDPTDPTCATAPNLIGLTLGDARSAWEPTFTGGFEPETGDPSAVVATQATTPGGTPGVTCLPFDASVVVTLGDPWPAPPEQPCRVPNFSDVVSTNAQSVWDTAHFTTTVILDGPANGKSFQIKSQSLVGGDYVSCDSTITLSNRPK
jgi:Flp pilus assembly protein TadG